MIKYLKKLWKKLFGKSETKISEHAAAGTRGADYGIKEVSSKPEHCVTHNRFKKSCPACQEIIK